MASVKSVVVTGSFDDFNSHQVRFLEEAAKLGGVRVLLWSDEMVRTLEGKSPKFPQGERLYLLETDRYVKEVKLVTGQVDRDSIPQVDGLRHEIWVVDGASDNPRKRAYCQSQGIEYHVLRQEDLKGFPALPFDRYTGWENTPQGCHSERSEESPQFLAGCADQKTIAEIRDRQETAGILRFAQNDRREAYFRSLYSRRSSRDRVMVTGCFDWFHSGHVRFFEVVSALGDLYVVVGHDANIKLLKGEGHPMFSQDERRYMVQSVRFVKEALVSSGHGWMDAAPEVAAIQPAIYAVNEDGDVPEKRAFCEEHGIQYAVFSRTPKEGLPERQSTKLREDRRFL